MNTWGQNPKQGVLDYCNLDYCEVIILLLYNISIQYTYQSSDIAKYVVTYAVLLPGNSMHLVHMPLLDLGTLLP